MSTAAWLATILMIVAVVSGLLSVLAILYPLWLNRRNRLRLIRPVLFALTSIILGFVVYVVLFNLTRVVHVSIISLAVNFAGHFASAVLVAHLLARVWAHAPDTRTLAEVLAQKNSASA